MISAGQFGCSNAPKDYRRRLSLPALASPLALLSLRVLAAALSAAVVRRD
jgi:hypothetical protein